MHGRRCASSPTTSPFEEAGGFYWEYDGGNLEAWYTDTSLASVMAGSVATSDNYGVGVGPGIPASRAWSGDTQSSAFGAGRFRALANALSLEGSYDSSSGREGACGGKVAVNNR